MAGLVLADGVDVRPDRVRALARRAGRDRPEVAAALRADPARPADHRHEQDREAHARAPEVPRRPRRRRRVLRARARRRRVPPVHRRPTRPCCTSRSCTTAANGSGTCSAWTSRSRPTRRRSRSRCARGSPRNVEVPPRFETIADEVEFGRRWQARARARPLGRHPLAARSTAGAARRRCRSRSSTWSTRARARCSRSTGSGSTSPGPTLLAHGTDEQKAALAAGDPHRRRDLVPAVQRARRGLRPRVADDQGRARRRRLAALGPEGVDLVRAVRPLGHLPGPHRPRRAEAQGHLVSRRRHAGARASRCARSCRSPATPSSTRCSSTRCSCPTTSSSARCTTAGPSRTRRSRTSAAPRSRSRNRSCTRCTSTSSGSSPPRAACSTTSRSPTRSRSRSSSCACCACTTGARCRG